jgi:hypothetical protein
MHSQLQQYAVTMQHTTMLLLLLLLLQTSMLMH